jgi:hypothetical protein
MLLFSARFTARKRWVVVGTAVAVLAERLLHRRGGAAFGALLVGNEQGKPFINPVYAFDGCFGTP